MKQRPTWEAPLTHDTKIHRRLLPEKQASDKQKPRFTQDMVCMVIISIIIISCYPFRDIGRQQNVAI